MGVVAGAFTVKVVDVKKQTIGSNYIEKDEQEYLIKTDAITDTSKVFTSFQSNPNAFNWIEKVKDPTTGAYIGFKIHLSTPAADRVYFDWWLVEQQDATSGASSAPASFTPAVTTTTPTVSTGTDGLQSVSTTPTTTTTVPATPDTTTPAPTTPDTTTPTTPATTTVSTTATP